MARNRFENKTALITGASSGIGKAAAGGFAAEGAHVAITYRKNSAGAEDAVADITAGGGRAFALQLDQTDPDQIRAVTAQVIERFDRHVDVLVNNAGQWMASTPVTECPDDLWHRMLDINLTGPFLLCREIAPIMVRQKSGAIVNVSSIASRAGGGGGSVPYAAAKAGLNNLTYGMARELAEHGVRVNGVAPGLVDTPIHANPPQERIDAWLKAIPLKRMGRPEDLTGAILYLASDEASYVTGEMIHVNGGLLMD